MRHTRQVGGGRRSGASPARRCAYLPRALGWKGSWSFGARAGVCRCVSLRGESGSARGSGACPGSRAETWMGMVTALHVAVCVLPGSQGFDDSFSEQ